MTLDAVARALALRLLNRYGKACVYKSITRSAYDPSTAGVITTTLTHPVKLYLEAPNQTELSSQQVVITDEMAIVPALGFPFAPKANDEIVIDGTNRTVKTVTRIWSGEQVSVFRIGLKS